MPIIIEKDIQINLPNYVIVRRFDDESTHCLSHCMKAVDYIIEMADRIVFLEIKDPDNPNATHKDRNKFFKELHSGTIDNNLKTKFRDSFLYEWACGRTTKPIHFWFLIGAENLDSGQLVRRTESLKIQLPINGPGGKPWRNAFVVDCEVMNLSAWNRQLLNFPAKRIST